MKTRLFAAFRASLLAFSLLPFALKSQPIVGKPPDYGQIALMIYDCGENRPSSRVFTLEAAVVWQDGVVWQPILTTEKGEMGLFARDGHLTWMFKDRSKSINRGQFETVSRPLADGRRHIVRLVHGAKSCAFFVDDRPVEARWIEPRDPANIRVGTGVWFVGRSDDVTFFEGYLQNMRLFDADLRDFDGLKSAAKRDSAVASKLLFDFWLDDWTPRQGAIHAASISSKNRLSSRPCGTASVLLQPGVELLPLEKERKTDLRDAGIIERERERNHFAVVFGVIFGVFLVMTILAWAASQSEPVGSRIADSWPILNEDLPPALAATVGGEEVDFVIRNRLPLPWTQLLFIGFVAIAGLVLFREKAIDALEKALSDDSARQTEGVLTLIGGLAGLAAFLVLLLWKEGLALRTLLGGRMFFIGTRDRLLLAEPSRGIFRPIFWEQIRTAERSPDGSNLRLELRTLSGDGQVMEAATPELLFLNGFEGKSHQILAHVARRLEAATIPPSGPDRHVNFGSEEAEQYARADFGVIWAYGHVVFVRKSPFGERPLVMLRRRIDRAVVEPYDLPRSGWMLVARLKTGARQPLAFFDELRNARSAADFLNQKS